MLFTLPTSILVTTTKIKW